VPPAGWTTASSGSPSRRRSRIGSRLQPTAPPSQGRPVRSTAGRTDRLPPDSGRLPARPNPARCSGSRNTAGVPPQQDHRVPNAKPPGSRRDDADGPAIAPGHAESQGLGGLARVSPRGTGSPQALTARLERGPRPPASRSNQRAGQDVCWPSACRTRGWQAPAEIRSHSRPVARSPHRAAPSSSVLSFSPRTPCPGRKGSIRRAR